MDAISMPAIRSEGKQMARFCSPCGLPGSKAEIMAGPNAEMAKLFLGQTVMVAEPDW
jgi:hypothetical protein